jgi:hypothetical protein
MDERRLVGIDLGITSAHTVRVLDGGGGVIARRKAVPTVASLTEIEQTALAGTPPGTRLEVVLEPTGPAWLPVACPWRCASLPADTACTGVYRVSSAKAHDLRRVLSRHAKSNGIDWDRRRHPGPAAAGRPGRVAPGCTRSSCPGLSGPRWSAACAPATGSPNRPPSTSGGSRTSCANCCPPAR